MNLKLKDWDLLGITSGEPGQILECSIYHEKGVWIETEPGSKLYHMFAPVNFHLAFREGSLGTDYRALCVNYDGSRIQIGNIGKCQEGYVPVAGCKIRALVKKKYSKLPISHILWDDYFPFIQSKKDPNAFYVTLTDYLIVSLDTPLDEIKKVIKFHDEKRIDSLFIGNSQKIGCIFNLVTIKGKKDEPLSEFSSIDNSAMYINLQNMLCCPSTTPIEKIEELLNNKKQNILTFNKDVKDAE